MAAAGDGASATIDHDALPWRPVSGASSRHDMPLIEELDGSEYDRIIALRKQGKCRRLRRPVPPSVADPECEKAADIVLPKDGKVADSSASRDAALPVDSCILKSMTAWTAVAPSLHPWLLKGLHDLGFMTPTPIQAGCLPPAIELGQCVLGAAETGSGKTLAFGLPILQFLATSPRPLRAPAALVLSPTRELAMQIVDHLRAVVRPFSFSLPSNRINIVPLVGGLSEAKQRRLLGPTHPPHIIVATPGRLWDLINSGALPAQDLAAACRFLVLDEADRMLEANKFKEVDYILGAVRRGGPRTCSLQTFVFSATLPTQANVAPTTPKPAKPARGIETRESKARPTLTTLYKRLTLRNPATVDLTSKTRTANSLTESCVRCLPDERDAVLYYLLARHPGRTLVFVNVISSIRRVTPILETLGLPVYSLHAQMQQRQRLKNLERFAADPSAILVASDVAARGIDVKNIAHVVHYQVPLSSELYVHRCGRTARALKEGLTIVLVTPSEAPAYRRICAALGKPDLQEVNIDLKLLAMFKSRFTVAQKLESLHHRERKSAHQRAWTKNTLKALELDNDDDSNNDDTNEEDENGKKKKNRFNMDANHVGSTDEFSLPLATGSRKKRKKNNTEAEDKAFVSKRKKSNELELLNAQLQSMLAQKIPTSVLVL